MTSAAPKHLFRRPDVPDAFQQLLEVDAGIRVLEAFVIEQEALNQVFTQVFGRPAAELCASQRAYPVANCQNGVEAIVINLPGDLSGTLLVNYPEFPDSCARIQLSLLVNVL